MSQTEIGLAAVNENNGMCLTGVQGAAVQFSSTVAQLQNEIRNKGAELAQTNIQVGCAVTVNAANSITSAAFEQAWALGAQACAAFGNALGTGLGFVGNRTSVGGAGIQKECDDLSQEIKEHQQLLDKMDQMSKAPSQGGIGEQQVRAENLVMNDKQQEAASLLWKNSKLSTPNASADENGALEVMQRTKKTDANGHPTTEFDNLKAQVKQQIQDKEKIKAGKQSDIQMCRQNISSAIEGPNSLFGQLLQGGSSTAQAKLKVEEAGYQASKEMWTQVQSIANSLTQAGSEWMKKATDTTESILAAMGSITQTMMRG